MAKLSHIGIAIKDQNRFKLCLETIGFKINHHEEVADQKVMTRFIPVHSEHETSPANIEILEPTSPDSVIQQYIDKNGVGGIHHLSFELEKGQLALTTKRLIDAGFKMTYPEARKGAHSMWVNFIHPKTTGGILIEIMEQQDGTGGAQKGGDNS